MTAKEEIGRIYKQMTQKRNRQLRDNAKHKRLDMEGEGSVGEISASPRFFSGGGGPAI